MANLPETAVDLSPTRVEMKLPTPRQPPFMPSVGVVENKNGELLSGWRTVPRDFLSNPPLKEKSITHSVAPTRADYKRRHGVRTGGLEWTRY